MGTETNVGDNTVKGRSELVKQKGQTQNSSPNTRVNTTNSRGKKGRGRQRKKTVAMSPVQRLYDTCKEVFAHSGTGVVPCSENIEKLKAVLDDIKPIDFGLSPEMPYSRTQAIGYIRVRECEKFSIGIFRLPPSGVIPLHNHPGMTVFSKLLFGTMHIKSYDWVVDVPCTTSDLSNPSEVNQSGGPQSQVRQLNVLQPEFRLARVKVDSDFIAPCDTSILYPADGGNMHRFTAKTACAVLDVLGPPYNAEEDRHCTYYYDFPYSKFSVDGVAVPEEQKESYAWLQERDEPKDLVVVRESYKGPKIMDK
uniref:cysteine dioxygenase n=1 Tax=Rhizophora mucronata TaxID=61149 RepID=A0A2P2JRN8_RHIMU